ncbi:sporulation peptidase YabG, partial [Clostridium perfringens]
MNLGDLVVRKSYGGDVTFRVEGMRQNNNIVIKGSEFRLLADAPIDDLVTVPHPNLSERTKQAQIKANESLDRLQKHRQEQSERQLASLRNIEG